MELFGFVGLVAASSAPREFCGLRERLNYTVFILANRKHVAPAVGKKSLPIYRVRAHSLRRGSDVWTLIVFVSRVAPRYLLDDVVCLLVISFVDCLPHLPHE